MRVHSYSKKLCDKIYLLYILYYISRELSAGGDKEYLKVHGHHNRGMRGTV